MNTETNFAPQRTLLLLGIDVEATGAHLVRNAPYSLSSIIVDGETNAVVSSFLEFCRPHPDQEWDPDTYAHFLTETTEDWRDLVFEKLMDPHTQTPGMMMNSWLNWLQNTLHVLNYSPRTHNLLPLVDTTMFDKSMLGAYLPRRCRGMDYLTGEFNPWFDIRSYYAGLAQVDIASGRYTAKQFFDIILSQNQELCKRFNVESDACEIGQPHDHNPLHDVTCIIFEFNKLRKALNLSL